MSFGLIAFWSDVCKEQTEKEKKILNKQNEKKTMNHHLKVATFFIIPVSVKDEHIVVVVVDEGEDG